MVDFTSACSPTPKLIWGIRLQDLERSKRNYIRRSLTVVSPSLAQLAFLFENMQKEKI